MPTTKGRPACVDAAPAVYLAGDSSMHLRSVLKDTAVFAALRPRARTGRSRRRHRTIGGGAQRPDVRRPRRRASRSASDSQTGVAIIPESETWSDEALARTPVAGDDADDRAADRVGGGLPRRSLGAGRRRRRQRRPCLTPIGAGSGICGVVSVIGITAPPTSSRRPKRQHVVVESSAVGRSSRRRRRRASSIAGRRHRHRRRRHRR